MIWCVCCDKKTRKLFLMTRRTREVMLRWWLLISQMPPSYVVKTFDNYDDAENYIDEQERVDKELDNLFK